MNGWADVATKRDLDVLRGDLDAHATTMRMELEAFRQEVRADRNEALGRLQHRMTMQVITINSGLAVVVAGLAFAAARLV